MPAFRDAAATGATLALGLTTLLFFEWHTDEPAVVLPVLLVVAFLAGMAVPSRFLLLGLTLGWAIAVAHALSAATGAFTPFYQKQPPSTADWVAMALLAAPAVAAAFAGSRLVAPLRTLIGRPG